MAIKRIFIITVMMCILATVAACKKNGVDNKILHAVARDKFAFSEDGMFYISKNQLVHFISAETKEDMIFCTDLSCMHEPYNAETNPDPKCRAALFGAETAIAYYDGALYYFVNEKYDSHKIYRMNINEAGRKCIANIPAVSRVTTYGAVFYEDHIYYVTAEAVEEAAENEEILKVKYYPYITEVNISDGSSRSITQADDEKVKYRYMDVYGNSLFFERHGEKNSFIRIDLTTLENTVVICEEEYSNLVITDDYSRYSGYQVIGVCDEEHYYCYKWNEDETENTVYKKNALTGKEEVLLKGNITNLSGCGDSLYYTVNTGKDYYDFEAYYYDVKNGRRYNMTQNQKKYGTFLFYEGYSNKFLGVVTELERDAMPKLYEYYINNRESNGKSVIYVLKDGKFVTESYDLLGYAAVDLHELLTDCKAEKYKP